MTKCDGSSNEVPYHLVKESILRDLTVAFRSVSHEEILHIVNSGPPMMSTVGLVGVENFYSFRPKVSIMYHLDPGRDCRILRVCYKKMSLFPIKTPIDCGIS